MIQDFLNTRNLILWEMLKERMTSRVFGTFYSSMFSGLFWIIFFLGGQAGRQGNYTKNDNFRDLTS